MSLRILHRTDCHQCGGQQVRLLRLNLWDIQAAIPDLQLDRFIGACDARIHSAFTPNGPGSLRKDIAVVAAHRPGAVREDRCEARP